jgi:hypothetical protein
MNAIDIHTQDFVVNDELLLPVLKAFGHAVALHSLLEMLDLFNLYVVVVE